MASGNPGCAFSYRYGLAKGTRKRKWDQELIMAPYENAARRQGTKVAFLFLLLAAVIASLPATTCAQNSKKPLSRKDLVGALESGVPPERAAVLVRKYGVSFPLTPDNESALRDAGATDAVISAVREVAPKAPAPPLPEVKQPPTSTPPANPVLTIEATPGGAQVYIDDELVGTTSSQGRLKLTRLSAGQHHVRLGLEGYRDFDGNVELAVGQQMTFAATLDKASAPPPPSNPSTSQPSVQTPRVEQPASNSPQSQGTLGVLVTPSAQGTPGLLISAVSPNGPAQRAGLRPGYTILQFNGQAVNTTQDLMRLLSAHRPGEVVTITYSNGSMFQNATVMLAGREAVAAIPPTMAPLVFAVMHDHGNAGQMHCVGVLTITPAMVTYRSTNNVHSFDIPVDTIREAKRNAVYMVAIGGFHIRLKKGTNLNFVAINVAGQYQPPDAILEALDRVMSAEGR